MKYKIIFKAWSYCTREVEIKDDSDPYKEANEICDQLEEKDFSVDLGFAFVDNLRPIISDPSKAAPKEAE